MKSREDNEIQYQELYPQLPQPRLYSVDELILMGASLQSELESLNKEILGNKILAEQAALYKQNKLIFLRPPSSNPNLLINAQPAKKTANMAYSATDSFLAIFNRYLQAAQRYQSFKNAVVGVYMAPEDLAAIETQVATAQSEKFIPLVQRIYLAESKKIDKDQLQNLQNLSGQMRLLEKSYNNRTYDYATSYIVNGFLSLMLIGVVPFVITAMIHAIDKTVVAIKSHIIQRKIKQTEQETQKKHDQLECDLRSSIEKDPKLYLQQSFFSTYKLSKQSHMDITVEPTSETKPNGNPESSTQIKRFK